MGEPKVYPEWVTTDGEKKIHDDFVYFVWMLWRHLKLPNPTKRQRAMARFLQQGPRRILIMAWRGAAKTFITCAYALWCLYRNPQERIKIISANEEKAKDNAVFIRRLIDEVPELQFLRPRGAQRTSVLAFDVGPADAAPTPSVSALGITGQLTGGRASILISDDVEVPKNSWTESMRERLAELIKEYDALIVPGGRIIYLGTPQTEQSIYNIVRKRGYECRIWPARYPASDLVVKYDGALAPDVVTDLKAGAKVGTSIEPERFSDLDLAEREAVYAKSGFALQFMLDTSLSDAERYPLKQADLIYFDCQQDILDTQGKVIQRAEAPVRLAWASDSRLAVTAVANLGFAGDRLYRPLHASETRSAYTGAVLVIDPSGRGKDHTAVCVVKSLDGQLYLTSMKGFKGGYEPDTLQAIVDLALVQQVKHVVIESNFGDGMFQKLIEPYFARTYPCTIEEWRATGRKELRIIEDVEPILNQHRLAIDSKVVEEDLKIAEDTPQYSFLYQLTHLTKEPGSLRHDDKIDVLAIAMRHFREAVAVDHQRAEAARRAKLRDEEFAAFERAALGYTTRRGGQQWVTTEPSVLRRTSQRRI